jgi:hypothetical protein
MARLHSTPAERGDAGVPMRQIVEADGHRGSDDPTAKLG